MVTIDIDGTSGVDLELRLYQDVNGTLTLLRYYDDQNFLDSGSVVFNDPFGQIQLGQGRYVIAVQRYPSQGLLEGTAYTLNVSRSLTLPVIDGAGGDDTLNGSDGTEVLVGGAGRDTINAGGGNDFLLLRPGDLVTGDVIDGGAGVDTLQINPNRGPAVDLSLNALSAINVERLEVSGGVLRLTGDQIGAFQEIVITGAPQDVADRFLISDLGAALNLSTLSIVNFNAFNDLVVIDATGGPTTIQGSRVIDQVSYAAAGAGVFASMIAPAGNSGAAAGDTYVGVEQLAGSAFDDVLAGDGAANALYGGAGADALYGNGGRDFLFGEAGDDILISAGVSDYLDGGEGRDFVSYAFATNGVGVFLQGGGFQGIAQGDIFRSIEGIIGSSSADVIGGGDLSGDTLAGEGGSDWLLGLGGNDTLLGGAGADVLNGGLGADSLVGGAGDDVAFYREAAIGVQADLVSPNANTGEAAGDVYDNVENVWGSRFNDVLAGAATGGQVYGFEGNDALTGRAAGDVFYGGLGRDTITTGAGADDVFFLRWDPGGYEGDDAITDFQSGVDRITVSRFWFGFGDINGPAAALTTGQAQFRTAGDAVGYLPAFRFEASTGRLYFDGDGVGASVEVLMATLQPGAVITLSDIWTA